VSESPAKMLGFMLMRKTLCSCFLVAVSAMAQMSEPLSDKTAKVTIPTLLLEKNKRST
jgi:hypothetical protein